MIALMLALQVAPALELRCPGVGSTLNAANVVDVVSFRIEGDRVSVRYPQALYTDVLFRREWRELSDVVMDDRFIRGRFTLNPINRPTVEIDRASGAVTIRALQGQGFRGECSAIDPSARRF